MNPLIWFFLLGELPILIFMGFWGRTKWFELKNRRKFAAKFDGRRWAKRLALIAASLLFIAVATGWEYAMHWTNRGGGCACGKRIESWVSFEEETKSTGFGTNGAVTLKCQCADDLPTYIDAIPVVCGVIIAAEMILGLEGRRLVKSDLKRIREE